MTCKTGFGSKNCNQKCPHGHDGYNCTLDGNSCQPNLCHPSNSLKCIDKLFDYTCTCKTGFGGKNCDRICPHGYDGYNCTLDGNSCQPNLCHPSNSLKCIDKLFDYTCTCKTGFGGKNCDRICPHGYDGYNCTLDGNSCQPNLCHPSNSLKCIDKLFDYTCTCKTGFGGKNCNCNPYLCNSTNTRECRKENSSYTCVCKTGFGGKNCDRICPHGYDGYNCTLDGNSCQPNLCHPSNSLKCIDKLFDYTCTCKTGFGGKNCNCNPYLCNSTNTRECRKENSSYTCVCKTGFGGKNCDRICPHGYDGYNCTLDGNSCQPNLCHPSNSLNCSDKLFDYNCTCKTGFKGKNCSIRNYCDPNPCNSQNTRECLSCPCRLEIIDFDFTNINPIMNYWNIDPCNSYTELCIIGLPSYRCVCKTGYKGSHCDTRNYCDPYPCNFQNTRECRNGLFSYTCVCKTGFEGSRCQRRNYCISNPCNSQNSYYCINGNSDYTCRCKAGYGGKNCEVDYCAGKCSCKCGRCVRTGYSPYYRCECKSPYTPESQCCTLGPGCLSIIIKYARGLDDKDGFLAGDSDPYVRVTAYSISGHSASTKTRHIQGDESPDWNHRFNAGCGRNWNRFFFKVYDRDVGSDDSLSSGQYVYLTSLSCPPSYSYRVDLVGGSGYIVFDIFYS